MSAPIRLMHFSDVHFGVENYGRFDPQTGLNTRLIDFRDALMAAIDVALEAGVEVAIFAGDAYKTRDPSQTHQREFAACIQRLTARNVPVVLLTGNHDVPNMRGKANAIEIFAALSGELVHVIDRPRVIPLQTRSGRRIQLAGLPYLTKSSQFGREDVQETGVAGTTEAVVKKYTALIESLAAQCAGEPDLPSVLIGHFSVSNATIGQTQASYLTNEPQVPIGDLALPAFDYVALGHIHKFQDLNRGFQPPVVYCGSIERIDFGERNEPKGFVMVDIAKGSATYQFVEGKSRPFVEIDLDLTTGDGDPTTRVIEAILQRDMARAIVKLSYRINSADAPLVRDSEIRDALAGAFLVVAIHKEVVRDQTRDRSAILRESLDPVAALSAYIDTKETLRPRKDELLALGRELVAETVEAA